MASKKKLKVRIKQLREVAKCERTERLALDRHCDSLLTLFNEECARNEKLKAELTLYEDRDNDRWMSYCHGWENGRSTAFDSRLTVGHTILKTWTAQEKEKLRQKLARNAEYKALTAASYKRPKGMPRHHQYPDWLHCDRCHNTFPKSEWDYLSCMCEKCSKDRSRWECKSCGQNLGLKNSLKEGRRWYGFIEYCQRCIIPPEQSSVVKQEQRVHLEPC